MVRPRIPMLSVEKIALAALEQIDATGDFSIPVLAEQLGVSASSLYHHVEGRAGIIEAVRQHLSAGNAGALLVEPEGVALHGGGVGADGAPPTWQFMLRRWARAYVIAMSQHPLAMPLMVRESVNDETALTIYETAAQIFTRAGFTCEQTIIAMTVIENLGIGTALDEAAPAIPWAGDPERHVALTKALDSVTPGTRGMLAFDFGLDAIIVAMERMLEQNTLQESAG